MSKNPVSKCCKAPAKIIIGEGISFWECTQCKMSCDTVESEEPKQIACECYQTVNGKVHCALHCPNGYDHSKLNPAPSLNTWEEEFDKEFFHFEGASSDDRHTGLKELFRSQINLAIQKERKRIYEEIDDCRAVRIVNSLGETDEDNLDLANDKEQFNKGIDKALEVVNKGVEEK